MHRSQFIVIILAPKNPAFHSNTKHIPIRYNFLREKVTNTIVSLHYIPSKDQIVDIFTKPLEKDQFEYLR
jgi:hypothetical protein